MTDESRADLELEFDRQIENLVRRGYPKLAGISVGRFLMHIEPLRRRLEATDLHGLGGRIPFIIVITREMVTPELAMPLVEIDGAKGSVNMIPVDSSSFSPVESLQIPDGPAYLLVNVDTGRETLNIRPEDALRIIIQENRSPLTIDEGVSLVSQYPMVLTDKKNHTCFQMLGSRRGDQRIPSMWISYGKPRLGWCWDRNPHTWLGSASCRRRVGA